MRNSLKYLFSTISKLMFVLTVVSWVFGFFVPVASSATYYMPDDFPNLQTAFSRMGSGDILIIRDGIYTGSENNITHTQKPTSGSEGAYTVVAAENNGEVVFDGTTCLISDVSYLEFRGIIWRGYNTGNIVSVGSATQPHHIKFLQCGAFSSASISSALRNDGFTMSYAHHILLEDCYAWGNMRYAFYAAVNSDAIIFRRCVSRIDAYNTQTGIASFMIYDSRNIEVQNCISIDMDNSASYYLLNGVQTVPNAFYTRNTEEGYALDNVNIVGSVAINIATGQFVIGGGGNDFDFSNCVFWDGYNGIRSRYSGGSWDHCLSGKVRSMTTSSQGYYTEQSSEPITNSIAYGIMTNGIQSSSTYSMSSYNCLYNNGNNYVTAAVDARSFCLENANAIDPIDGSPGNGTAALKYLLRIEDGSDLDGAASDGGDIGATIIKRIGKTGTLWGELGYNLLQNGSNGQANENLWPFPNEDIIREHMRTYSYDNGKLSGARGFCSDGKQLNGVDDITLTSYIWEYLGNQIPPEIYGNTLLVEDLPDTTPPVISSVGTTNIASTSATLTWSTDELASCIIDYGTTVAYGLQAIQTTPAISHQVTLYGLQPSTTYHYKIKCVDGSNNISESNDYIFITQALTSVVTNSTLQNFEDGVLWVPGGSQDPSGKGRGWAFLDPVTTDKVEIAAIGANGSKKSLKVTFVSSNSILFRSNDKITDMMPEAKGANRMSFYVRFPEGFPIQPLPYRYDTWQLGTYIHDPDDWYDTHEATFEDDHGIHHYYHRLTIEQVGDGWVKYIVTTHPDQANYSGSTVPPDIAHYFNEFGRFYFQFGAAAGGPEPPRPFSIWIDEIKFYYDDGTVGGEIHVGGQDDAGFDGEFLHDRISPPEGFMKK